MRSFLIILYLILFSCFTSFAQVFKVGLVTGISAAQIEGDGFGGYNKLGFIAGGFVNTDLSEKVSTQFEIYFINKGSFDAAHPDKGDFDKFSVNLNYIEIPVVLRYMHNKFKIEAGLYYAKLVGTPHLEDESGEVFVNRFPFKSYDFGGLVGLNYQLNDHFSFNFRSKNSFISIRDVQSLDQNLGLLNRLFNQGWYNVDLNLSVRYQFGS